MNEYTLGMGWDGAPLVVMGTEPNEDPGVPEQMAFHCLYALLLLCESRFDVVTAIADGSAWRAHLAANWHDLRRSYHLEPNDFVQVGAGSTWAVVARIVAADSDPASWRSVLRVLFRSRGWAPRREGRTTY